MVYAVILLVLLSLIAEGILVIVQKSHPAIKQSRYRALYWWHMLFVYVYYVYALDSASDSKSYYKVVADYYKGTSWSNYYGISTEFIHWLNFPLVEYFQFPYEASMLFFGFLGFLGWLFVYLTFLERTHFKHTVKLAGVPVDLLTLIIFLPNNHFWSGSLGKGSAIIFGLGLLLYGLSKPYKRLLPLILGGVFAYHVRPHILYVVLVGVLIGFVYSNKGLASFYRWGLAIVGAALLVFLLNDVMTLTGFDTVIYGEGEALDKRASDLTRAGSGVNIENMSLPEKFFSFLYRPLFFDAHNGLALYTSFENLIYLLLTFQFFRKDIIRFILGSNYLVISALVTFVAISFVLAQISGNLGLAMRQKSQVFFLLLFVLLQYKDYKARQRFEWRMYRHQQSLAS